MNKKEQIPIFLLGFYIWYFLNGAGLTMIGMTIFGALLAILMMQAKKSKEVA